MFRLDHHPLLPVLGLFASLLAMPPLCAQAPVLPLRPSLPRSLPPRPFRPPRRPLRPPQKSLATHWLFTSVTRQPLLRI